MFPWRTSADLCNQNLTGETAADFADESTAHLDRENQKSVENMLLSSESALVYIAHNYNREMMERFDRVIELKNGKIRTVTEVDDIETINR